jgi:hypothetical protein
MHLAAPRLRALALTAAVLTLEVLWSTPDPAHASAPTGRYVALGDSMVVTSV